MAPAKKRENRENQFYDVGVQGRKTGITLEDRGVRDEHGMEPLSGIFSSPQKSPPKRGASDNVQEATIESESMDIQESSIPELATSAHLVRNSRIRFPVPKSRSPIKTFLGSSPRRPASMGPRAQSANLPSSPFRASSNPAVNRVLDFEQDESSLQETPALSGSGQPRSGKRRSVYDIEISPTRDGTTLEDSIQEEITTMEDSGMLDEILEQTYVGEVENNISTGAEASEVVEEEESEVVEPEAIESEIVEPKKQPAKRGRKRKSEAMEPPAEEEAPKSRRRVATSTQASESQKGKKAVVPASDAPRRRSKRVSDIAGGESSITVDASSATIEEAEIVQAAPKRRGRPPKDQPKVGKTAVPAKAKPKEKEKEKEPEKENVEAIFKKPKAMARSKKNDNASSKDEADTVIKSGKLVNLDRKPLPKEHIDQLSATSAATRYGRGRQLSVYRELQPEAVAQVGRTGRHRVKPLDFWRNETIAYDPNNNMQAIIMSEYEEPIPRKQSSSKSKSKRRGAGAIEQAEDFELEPWEEEEGVFPGIYREYDSAQGVATEDHLEGDIAWAQKGIKLVDVPDAAFKFCKLGSVGEDNFLSWGFIELQPDQMKRTKNSRRMHMVFHVQSGAVEFKIYENVFTLHPGGVCQVPRGNTYSIKNVGSDTSRIFFAQGCEAVAEE